MVRGIFYTCFLIIFAGVLPLLPLIHAAEENTIVAGFSEIKPRIDAKFTTQSEWEDATITSFQSNGYNFYVLAKQDRNFIYLMFDGVDFQTNPKDNSTSVRYQATICFDDTNDKGTKRQSGDFCHTSTVNNEFGKQTQMRNVPLKFDSQGNPSHLDLQYGFMDRWGFGSQNDSFEESDHLMYEVRVPKDLISNGVQTGFAFEVFFDSAHDDLVQLVDGVSWPAESQKEDPSTWGTIILPKIECQNDLELILKTSDMSSVCATHDTAAKLIERGWAKPESSFGIPTMEDLGIRPHQETPFAIRFYHQAARHTDGNIFFSPTSIKTAFGVAYEGAQGTTAKEMEQVFGFEPDDQKRRAEIASIQSSLNPSDKKLTLRLANALWLAHGFEPLEEYVDTVTTYYGSQVDTLNFASADAVNTINGWVDNKTEGKIEELFQGLDPNTRLVITNAIYFKGNWTNPFDKERTTDTDFVTPQKTVQVPMMSRDGIFNYTKDNMVEVVELPYQGDRLSMLIILPDRMVGLTPVEDSLTIEKMQEWKNSLAEQRLLVQIPKFTLETEYDLNRILSDLHVISAFSSSDADFSGISGSKGLFIEKAIHKAFVDVNEEGTEAAAATGIVMQESAPPTFRADHPFMFLIQDNKTGEILFMGRVTDPTK
ncbi:MAG TPA: serpin family protein [Candidatus Binatia bacterium]|nr:serpin family protein [Candidatus Binatia bacterium]